MTPGPKSRTRPTTVESGYGQTWGGSCSLDPPCHYSSWLTEMTDISNPDNGSATRVRIPPPSRKRFGETPRLRRFGSDQGASNAANETSSCICDRSAGRCSGSRAEPARAVGGDVGHRVGRASRAAGCSPRSGPGTGRTATCSRTGDSCAARCRARWSTAAHCGDGSGSGSSGRRPWWVRAADDADEPDDSADCANQHRWHPGAGRVE